MTVTPWILDDEPLPSPKNAPSNDPNIPSGLIALTESISTQRLIEAYRQGIFPWYSRPGPVMWWCTSPRMVLETSKFKVSQSLKKTIRAVLLNPSWEIRVDCAFKEVIQACANSPRNGEVGDTWITPAIIEYYGELHQMGLAHSVETWYDGQLVGGLYGVNLGKMLYGESMFTRVNNASKLALAALCAWCVQVGIRYIDCQQETSHLASLGASPLPQDYFLNWLESQIDLPAPLWNWDKSVLLEIQ